MHGRQQAPGPRGVGLGAVRAFRAARRHSIVVRILRLAMPIVAVLLVGAFTATTWQTMALRGRGIQVGSVRITSDSLVMANPRYEGFGKDGSRYHVRAQSADTALERDAPIRLRKIEGDLVQPSGVTTKLTAERGTYDQKASILELEERIDVRSSDGMTAKLTQATVHTRESRVVSRMPIEASLPTGQLKARTMEFDTKQRRARFVGSVELRLSQPPPAPTGGVGNGASKVAKRKASAPGIAPGSGEPIDVTSETLDVNDVERIASFRSRVVARQGAASLAAPELDAFYEATSAPPGTVPPVSSAPSTKSGDGQRLRAIEARGGIVMIRDSDRITATALRHDAKAEQTVIEGPVRMSSASDRSAQSARLVIDHKADRIELEGGVIVTQGKNVLRGERLAVDRARGRSRLDSPATAGRGAGRISVLLHRPPSARQTGEVRKSPKAEVDGPLGNFRADPTAPIEIEAAALDLEETRHAAVFTGTVVARQGNFVMRTPSLTAHYTGETGLLDPAGAAAREDKGAASLRKIEARSGVVFVASDGQQVKGDWADIDPIGNFATVGGRVVATQGKNAVEGSKMIIDMTTGRTRFETTPGAAADPPPTSAVPCPPGQTCPSKGRVRAVFYPKDLEAQRKAERKTDRGRSGATRPAPEATRRPAPGAPSSSSWQSTTKPGDGGGQP